MKTGFALSQWLSLARIASRRPVLSTRMNVRLLARALSFLADNPDLLRITKLLDPDAALPTAGEAALILTSGGAPRFSFVLSAEGRGNLSRPQMEALLKEPALPPGLQLLVVDEAAFLALREAFEADDGSDPFHLAALSLWNSWRKGLIEIRPAPAEEELAKAIAPEDALARFGPRFGLYTGGPKPPRGFLETPRKLLAAVRRGPGLSGSADW